MPLRHFFHKKHLYIASLILCGSCATLISAELDTYGFNYPIFSCAVMFAGESLCIIFNSKSKSSRTLLRSNLNYTQSIVTAKGFYQRLGKYGCCLSALFDFIDNVMEFYCYLNLWPEAIVALKMFSIFYVLVYRRYVMRKIIYKHQRLGLGILVFGMIVSVYSIGMSSERSYSLDTKACEFIAVMIFSQLFAALTLISMENVMWNCDVTTEEVNFIKGVTGIGICAVLYVPLSILLDGKVDFNGLLEPFLALTRPSVAGLVGFLLFSLFILNWVTAKALKITEALAICTIDAGRLIILWTIYISLSFNKVKASQYMQISAGVLIIVGLLIYNELLIIPWFGLRKAAKISMKENQAFKEEREKTRGWQYRLEGLL